MCKEYTRANAAEWWKENSTITCIRGSVRIFNKYFKQKNIKEYKSQYEIEWKSIWSKKIWKKISYFPSSLESLVCLLHSEFNRTCTIFYHWIRPSMYDKYLSRSKMFMAFVPYSFGACIAEKQCSKWERSAVICHLHAHDALPSEYFPFSIPENGIVFCCVSSTLH